MKRFQELLMKDLGWKLLSVAIAAIMWFMVINITQPVDTRSYSRPITLENFETLTNRGLTIGNEEELKNTKVTIKVKAQRTALDRLNQNPEWLQASVDFSGLTSAVNGDIITLPINVSMQSSLTGYDIVSKSPAAVEAHVETLISRRMPVQLTLNGEFGANTYLSEPTLSSETVLVTGPYSVMSRVAAVRATVNAADIMETPEIRVKLTAYDSAGTPVKGVSISIPDVLVSYALHDVKQVPIQVDITGTPAVGYAVGEITCTPPYAEVIGAPEVLQDLMYLQLENIDVTDADSAVSQTFSLKEYLPEGLSLKGNRNGSEDTVQIVVDIIADNTAQSSKVFTLDETTLSLLGQEGGMLYTFGEAQITVSGDAEALDALTEEDLNGSIDVSGLTEGEHEVMIHTELPEEFTAEPASISVTVSSEGETSEEIEEE